MERKLGGEAWMSLLFPRQEVEQGGRRSHLVCFAGCHGSMWASSDSQNSKFKAGLLGCGAQLSWEENGTLHVKSPQVGLTSVHFWTCKIPFDTIDIRAGSDVVHAISFLPSTPSHSSHLRQGAHAQKAQGGGPAAPPRWGKEKAWCWECWA